MTINALTADQVYQALSQVYDPELRRDLVSLGMVQDVQVDGGAVAFTLRLTTPACPLRDRLEAEARQAVAAIPGVTDVVIEVETSVPTGFGMPQQQRIPGVRQIIVVGSGKGGVGKTTVSVNLALALAGSGAQVGLLDADFYGPNVPQMLGAGGAPQLRNKKLTPIEAHGLRVMSFAYLMEPGKSLIWRGPLLMAAVQQMLFEVDWGELDYLVIDLPPGTGDVQLSLAQLVPLAGALMVTTPQGVAVSDVVRAVQMFETLGVPLLGFVENMSYLECPGCGRRLRLFRSGGAAWLSEQFGAPVLGEFPLDPAICESGDTGQPVALSDSQYARLFTELARQAAARVSVLHFAGEAAAIHPGR